VTIAPRKTSKGIEGFEPVSDQLDLIGKQVVDSAYRVHSQLGSGLLESVYEECLIYDLREKGFFVNSQLEIPICYFDISLKSKLRLDIVVDNSVIIELKAVEKMIPLY